MGKTDLPRRQETFLNALKTMNTSCAGVSVGLDRLLMALLEKEDHRGRDTGQAARLKDRLNGLNSLSA